MRRRGQYALIEQVILFTLGISITLGFLVAFENLTEDIRADMAETQTELVSRYVASSAVELVASGSEGRFTLGLPETVAAQVYALRVTDDGVEVETVGQSHTASLHGLTSVLDESGAVESRAGGVVLEYRDGTLTLE